MGLISRVSSRTYRGIFILNEHEGTRRSQRILNHRAKIAIRHGAKPQVVPTTDLRSRLRRRQVQVLEILVLLPEDQQEGREIVECAEVHESHPGCVKNYGIWIRYDSRSTSENMYREYRDVALPLAVTQMYREMAARHRARPGSIQVLRTKQVKSNECRRPQNKAMHDPNIKFPLPRRVMSKKAQHERRFSTKRPNTVY